MIKNPDRTKNVLTPKLALKTETAAARIGAASDAFPKRPVCERITSNTEKARKASKPRIRDVSPDWSDIANFPYTISASIHNHPARKFKLGHQRPLGCNQNRPASCPGCNASGSALGCSRVNSPVRFAR